MSYDEQSFLNGLAAGLSVTGGNKASYKLMDSFDYIFDGTSSNWYNWGDPDYFAMVIPIRFYTVGQPGNMRVRITFGGSGLYYNKSTSSLRTDSEIQQFIPDYIATPHVRSHVYSSGRRFYLNLRCTSEIQTSYIMVLSGSYFVGVRVLEALPWSVLECYEPIILISPRSNAKLVAHSMLYESGDSVHGTTYSWKNLGSYTGFNDLLAKSPIKNISGFSYVSYNGYMYWGNYAGLDYKVNYGESLVRKMPESHGITPNQREFWNRIL